MSRRPRSSAAQSAGLWRPAVQVAARIHKLYGVVSVIAVDPDLHTSGLAHATLRGAEITINTVWVASVPTSYKGQACSSPMSRQMPEPLTDGLIVVEGQQVNRQTPNMQSVLDLAQVAGACIGALSQGRSPVAVPTPLAWKGTVPKGIHHARICQRLGWPYRMAGSKSDKSRAYAIPEVDGFEATGSQWKHALDAVGLALWGCDRILQEVRMCPTKT